jgi:hypothetical protein
MPSVWNDEETRDIQRLVMRKKRNLQRGLKRRVKRAKRNAKTWGNKQREQIHSRVRNLQKGGGGGVGNLTREQPRKRLNTVPTNFQYYQ